MRTILRALALACVLAALPACSSLGVRTENPFVAAKTIDQEAYALIGTYAATLEEATDIVRDPSTPASVKKALAKAEAVATPLVETVEIATVAYLKAKADTASLTGAPAPTRAAATLTAATTRLHDAILAAEAPVKALQAALK